MKLARVTTVVALATAFSSSGCSKAAENASDAKAEHPETGTKTSSRELANADGSARVVAEVWVDNWFTLSVNGKQILEDSVPYATERSFNADRVEFDAEYPMTLAFEFRDFKENDTGLEYIGSRRQQVGDGGAVAQFTNKATGEVVAVTDATWKCLVTHHAPADEACATEESPMEGEGACRSTTVDAPSGWEQPGFDDSQWSPATVHEVSAVRPKDGYDRVEWSSRAKLIWSENLKLDNTVLCRTEIDGPT